MALMHLSEDERKLFDEEKAKEKVKVDSEVTADRKEKIIKMAKARARSNIAKDFARGVMRVIKEADRIKLDMPGSPAEAGKKSKQKQGWF